MISTLLREFANQLEIATDDPEERFITTGVSWEQLRSDEYENIPRSDLLPNLDLALLAEYVVQPDPLEAVLAFREKVREGLRRDR